MEMGQLREMIGGFPGFISPAGGESNLSSLSLTGGRVSMDDCRWEPRMHSLVTFTVASVIGDQHGNYLPQSCHLGYFLLWFHPAHFLSSTISTGLLFIYQSNLCSWPILQDVTLGGIHN